MVISYLDAGRIATCTPGFGCRCGSPLGFGFTSGAFVLTLGFTANSCTSSFPLLASITSSASSYQKASHIKLTYHCVQVTNRLFAQNGSFGMDLVALNIQRGRDHGLPPYNRWREICHLPPASSFQEFADVMLPEDAERLSSLYAHVDDVDLFIGGLLEKPKAGSLLGHTFLCIVGDQFARLRVSLAISYSFRYNYEVLMNNKNAEECYMILKNKIATATDHYIPRKLIRPTNNPPWFSQEIKRLINARQHSYRRLKRYQTEPHRQEHIHACRAVKRTIKSTKRNKEITVAAQAKTNPKSFYKYVNDRRLKRDTIGSPIDSEGSTQTNNKSKAKILNTYFTSVFTH
ncbi:hypothetical protein FHG87_021706, partial [Trinorchestia longiramus]